MAEYPLSNKEANRLAKFIQENPDELMYKFVIGSNSGIGTTYKIMTVSSEDDVVRGKYEDITDFDSW